MIIINGKSFYHAGRIGRYGVIIIHPCGTKQWISNTWYL